MKQSRKTNKSSCTDVLKVLELWSMFASGDRLSEINEFQYPQDIVGIQRAKKWMAVSGREGTIRGRYLDRKNQFMAKTGTLKDTSNLSGTIMTEKGKIHFSVMNHFSSQGDGKLELAKKIQRDIIDQLFSSFEGATPFEYQLSRVNNESTWLGTQKIKIISR